MALQFDGKVEELVRHDPPPAAGARTWTTCHAATIWPADFSCVLPHHDCIDAPELPMWALINMQGDDSAYEELEHAMSGSKRAHAEVTLLGYPTLYNPDPRHYLDEGQDWELLLQWRGDSSFFAGVYREEPWFPDRPSISSIDFVCYFVRRIDMATGTLDRGWYGIMCS